MAYDYQIERPKLFTEDGVRMIVVIRDNVSKLLAVAGAFTCERAISGCTGDSWLMLAVLDYLIELKELRRVTPVGSTAGQYVIYTRY